MELRSHAVTKEFFDPHVLKFGSPFTSLCTSPIRYPNLPLPSIPNSESGDVPLALVIAVFFHKETALRESVPYSDTIKAVWKKMEILPFFFI